MQKYTGSAQLLLKNVLLSIFSEVSSFFNLQANLRINLYCFEDAILINFDVISGFVRHDFHRGNVIFPSPVTIIQKTIYRTNKKIMH